MQNIKNDSIPGDSLAGFACSSVFKSSGVQKVFLLTSPCPPCDSCRFSDLISQAHREEHRTCSRTAALPTDLIRRRARALIFLAVGFSIGLEWGEEVTRQGADVAIKQKKKRRGGKQSRRGDDGGEMTVNVLDGGGSAILRLGRRSQRLKHQPAGAKKSDNGTVLFQILKSFIFSNPLI